MLLEIPLPDADDCASSPCSNGATCHDLFNGYICKCTESSHGTNCEKVETTAAFPSATCPTCPDCTTQTSCPSCPDVATQNPVTCPACPEITTSATGTCPVCPECTTDGTTCPSCPEVTTDGTICPVCPEVTNPVSETTTSCPTLEPEPDYCANDPCQNNGTCYNTTGDYVCVCSESFSGKNCSIGKMIICNS